jgi:hypothetical protein
MLHVNVFWINIPTTHVVIGTAVEVAGDLI